jgi:hypothetical protein
MTRAPPSFTSLFRQDHELGTAPGLFLSGIAFVSTLLPLGFRAFLDDKAPSSWLSCLTDMIDEQETIQGAAGDGNERRRTRGASEPFHPLSFFQRLIIGKGSMMGTIGGGARRVSSEVHP